MVKDIETTVSVTNEIMAEIDRISKTEGNLTLEDEIRLVEIYKLSGDARLGADVMFLKQYDSIKKICRSFVNKHNIEQDYEDYLQSTYEYLLEALDTFRFSKRTRFNTYLTVILTKCLNNQYYGNNGISKYYQQEYYKVGKFIASFEVLNGRKPTKDEILSGLSLSATRYSSLMAEIPYLKPVYYEQVKEAASKNKKDSLETEDLLMINSEHRVKSPEEILINEELSSELYSLLEELGPERREILYRYAGVGFDKPQSKKKICDETGISKNRLNKILDLILSYSKERLEAYY